MANPFSRYFTPRQSRVVNVQSRGGGSGDPAARNAALIQQLMASLTQGQDSRNAAAQAQYEDVLGRSAATTDSVRGVYDQTLGRLQELYGGARQEVAGVGNAARQRVSDDASRNFARSQQNMISRGLSASTVSAGLDRGIAADSERASQQIDESQAQLRAGLLTGQAGAETGLGVNRAGSELDLGRLGIDTALSKRDTSPDLSVYMQLLSQLGGA